MVTERITVNGQEITTLKCHGMEQLKTAFNRNARVKAATDD